MSDTETSLLAPRENPDLFGQSEAEQALLNAYQSGRAPHAWLISGQKGIGKATLAFRLARKLLSGFEDADDGPGLFGDELPAAAPSLAIDDEDPIFRQIAVGSHPDLLTIERAFDEKRKKFRAEIVVDDIRDAGQFLRLTSQGGGYRVVIIDSADEMNRNAANALLKVLEEPPGKTVIILVSHTPGRLLPTIRSRCRALKLRPLGNDIIEDLLIKHAPDVGEDERGALIQLAEGSIGRALSLHEAGGMLLYQQMLKAFETAPDLEFGRLDALAELWSKNVKGDGPDPFTVGTELLLGWIARGVEAQTLGTPFPELFEGEGQIAEKLFSSAPPPVWISRREEASGLFLRGTALNLDKRQMLLKALQGFSA